MVALVTHLYTCLLQDQEDRRSDSAQQVLFPRMLKVGRRLLEIQVEHRRIQNKIILGCTYFIKHKRIDVRVHASQRAFCA